MILEVRHAAVLRAARLFSSRDLPMATMTALPCFQFSTLIGKLAWPELRVAPILKQVALVAFGGRFERHVDGLARAESLDSFNDRSGAELTIKISRDG